MTKSKENKTAKRTKPPRRLSGISPVAAKSLGYTCENITAADAVSGLKVTLAGLFRYKKYAHLKAAFERGQFLRNLEKVAGSAPNLTRAARQLRFKKSMDLRNLLDTDPEADNLWRQKRLDLNVEQNKRVFDKAAEGSKWCIAQVEKFLTADEDGGRPAGSDLTRLIQKQIAELFAVERTTVRDWVKRFGCPQNSDGTYNLYEVIQWWGGYERGKSAAPIPAADEMRKIKVERLMREEAQARAELLERGPVIAGFAQRYERIIASCRHKGREIATMAHGQTVDAIEKLICHHHGDLRRQWSEPMPEFLQLPPAAEKKLNECMEILTTNGHE